VVPDGGRHADHDHVGRTDAVWVGGEAEEPGGNAHRECSFVHSRNPEKARPELSDAILVDVYADEREPPFCGLAGKRQPHVPLA
jgi:hypothetical protein